mgnify:FL=1
MCNRTPGNELSVIKSNWGYTKEDEVIQNSRIRAFASNTSILNKNGVLSAYGFIGFVKLSRRFTPKKQKTKLALIRFYYSFSINPN